MPGPVGTFRQQCVEEVPGAKQAGRMCVSMRAESMSASPEKVTKYALFINERRKGRKKHEKSAKAAGR